MARGVDGRRSGGDLSWAGAVRLLASAPPFRGLAPEELADVVRDVRHREISAGTTFHSPVRSAEVLYVVKRGRVRVYRLTPAGRKIILMEVRSPAVFGSMALLGQGMDGDFAEAVEDSLICTVSRRTLERLVHRRPDVALRLLAAIGNRLWEVERRVEEMAAFTAEQRLAALLLRLADSAGNLTGLTQEDLAGMSGVVRQTAARILGRWRRECLVAVGRRSVRILRRDGLAARAASRAGERGHGSDAVAQGVPRSGRSA